MQRLTKLSWRIFVFFIPTQLALHFWPDWALVFGIRVDYLSPAIYFTDFLFIALFSVSLFSRRLILHVKKSSVRFILAILMFILINIVSSTSPPVALYRWLKVFELFCIFILARDSKGLNFKKDLLIPLLFSGAALSLLGVWQFLKGSTIGGMLYFLGERDFNSLTPGIALVKIFGQDFLRAYSTFPHPNSLAGYLSLLLILFLTLKEKVFHNTIKYVILASITLAIFLSFSLGAWLGLLVVFSLYLILKGKIYSFSKVTKFVLVSALTLSAILVFLPPGFSERVSLAKSAASMSTKNPFFGVGFNNFIINLPVFSKDPGISWLLQPVHNIYLLTLSELGILGMCGVFMLFYKALKKSANWNNLGAYLAICFIVLVGCVDHYFLTIQQNTLLLALILGYSQRDKSIHNGNK